MARTRTKAHHGSITKRGTSWRIRLCVGGQYHSFTVKGGTKQAAENFATTTHATLTAEATRAKRGLPGPIRFSQLLDEFRAAQLPNQLRGADKTIAQGPLTLRSQRVYALSLDIFEAYFVNGLGDPLVKDLLRSHIVAFIEWRRTHRVVKTETGALDVQDLRALKKPLPSGFTVARDFRVLRRVFSYAIDKDHRETNPCARVSAGKPDPRDPPILTNEQFDAPLSNCGNPMLRLYALVLGETGMRAYTEALALKWTDIDLADGSITIRSTVTERNKSGKTRVVPMTRRLHEAMREHAAQHRLAQRSPYIFTHLVARRSAVAGERVKTFRGSFAAAVKAAQLPTGFRAHDLRHRRVTTFLAKGHSPALVQLAMGHASIATTLGYSHLTAQHLRSLVDEPTPAAAPAREATR